MKKLILLVLPLALAYGCSENNGYKGGSDSGSLEIRGEASSSSRLSSYEKRFVDETYQDGMFEVQLGKWALERGQSPTIRDLGARMVQDHTSANNELLQIASSKGFAVTTELENKRESQISKVTSLVDADFDNAYQKQMIEDHEKAIRSFEHAVENLQDADLKAFAQKTLPILQEHLSMARTAGPEAAAANANADRSVNLVEAK